VRRRAVQRDLGVPGLVNTVLLRRRRRQRGVFDGALRLEDLGVRVTKIEQPDGNTMLAVDSESGIVNDALEKAGRRAGERLGFRPPRCSLILRTASAKEIVQFRTRS
jgi:hypothetical protein